MRFVYFLALFLWLSASVAGVCYMASYGNTAAEKNVSYPKTFPKESLIERNAGQSTLLFFAHPKCPCTRASLHELNRLITDVNGKLKVYVVFMKPRNADENWTQTDLRSIAETIPDAQILIDESERETRIFNAQTSGLILLYDAQGNLRYDGGITSSRGHEGDNAGRQAIFRILTQDDNETAEMPVFGCPLRREDCPNEK